MSIHNGIIPNRKASRFKSKMAMGLILAQMLFAVPVFCEDTTTPSAVLEAPSVPVTPGPASENPEVVNPIDTTTSTPPTPTPPPAPPVKPIVTSPVFGDVYSTIQGVLNFRGGNFRNSPAYGTADIKTGAIIKVWRFNTGGKGLWGGGSGWTGQPALVKWPREVKKSMNLDPKYKNDDQFVEVIQGSLNGNVYFLDLKTGKQTRKPIMTGNPIKGSVSVDSRGYPLLYVGQGIQEKIPSGFRIYSLINQSLLFFQTGTDPAAPRLWPNSDSSALFEGSSDSLYVGGENGLVYHLKLNTSYLPDKGKISIKPVIDRFNTAPPGSLETKGKKEGKESKYGIENSLAAYKDMIYFADNGGTIRCIGTDMKERWKIKGKDDTDASITVEEEHGVPYLYTGCEVDWQGAKGNSIIRKIDGLTGKVVWTRYFMCGSRFGKSPSNGGVLATNIIGRNDLQKAVVFTICRSGGFDKGLMVALDKATGKTIWQWKMPTYAWSSPVPLYTKQGKSYIVQPDHNGTLWVLEGKSGRVVSSTKLDSYIEASASAFNNRLVLTSRTGKIYGLTIQ